jgi:hypothetical protein
MLAKYFVLLGAIALAVSPLSAQQSSIAAKGPEASSAAEAFKAFRSAPNRGQLQLGWLCGHWNRLYLGKRHLDCAHSRLREEPECLGIILGWY